MRIFLDANVLYAASCSKTGASFAIFELKNRFQFELITSQLALIEAERNLTEKEGLEEINNFYLLIKKIKVVKSESEKAKKMFKGIIEEKDAPILYAALKSKSSYLLTLDKKHFFTEKIKKLNLPIKIITPVQFIKEL
jgi:predicted nucleic acid-binding protein